MDKKLTRNNYDLNDDISQYRHLQGNTSPIGKFLLGYDV